MSVLREVGSAKLPALEHLESWLGEDGYGWDGTVADLEPLLSGKLFPKLRRFAEMLRSLNPFTTEEMLSNLVPLEQFK